MVLVVVVLAAVADLGAQLVVGLAFAAVGAPASLTGIVSGLIVTAALVAAVLWWRSLQRAGREEEERER